MWALRRAANPLRSQGYQLGASRACCATSEILRSDSEHGLEINKPANFMSHRCFQPKRFYHTPSIHGKNLSGSHGLSSQAGAESSGEEDDLEDGFSELESPPITDETKEINSEEKNAEELVSEPELSEEDSDDAEEDPYNELDVEDAETGVTEKIFQKKKTPSELFQVIMKTPRNSINTVLDKWLKEGNDLGRSEISLAMLNLRKRRMYGRALQLSEWLEANKHLNFVERDYASRLDLIAKERGLNGAEKYIEKIPNSFRGEIIYRTLLANCVSAVNVKKAEEVFNKMRDLEFPITAFACNQLLLLYKRIDKKKIADILLLMEKEDVKPTLFTYRLLIDTKGQSNDISGMEQLVETMKAEGVEPDIKTQALIARHYIYGGLKEKAEAVLKEMVGSNLKDNRGACGSLLPLYASLGKTDEVAKIWKVCELNPRLEECLAAIEAWGKLGRVEEAEAVFERMIRTWKKLSSRHYTSLMKVYANHKLLAKGKDLAKRMANSGCQIGPMTWDALVKLYVEAGEVEKADSILQKAGQQNQMRPLFSSFMTIMDQYAKRGDVHNTEKIFHRLRQSGYVGRVRQYQVLLQAYINAKAPAYGFRERMKGDNIFPNRLMAAQLTQVDAFRKTAISDLLD